MSLLHPTTGEMWDRVAVLNLKISNGSAAGKDVRHFEEERAEISVVLLRRDDSVSMELLDELVQTHAAIWPLIETSPPELLRLNARRVAIREEIDKATGEFRGNEKI
jgi:hypothetical protein